MLIFAPITWAQSDLNPASERATLIVNQLSFEGFSSFEKYPIDLDALREFMLEQRAAFPNSMSVDQLHQIADAMTLWVRRKGYPFHRVYLPPQPAENGNVKFVMLEGKLTDVNVINKTPWPDRRFSKLFDRYLNDLLYAPAVEQTVFALKAQTGLRVFAFYSRALGPGEARLNLRIEKAKTWSKRLKFDNYGNDVSGEHRATLQVSKAQLTGRFDHLSLALLQTIDDVSNTFISLGYEKNFGGLNWLFDLGASNNRFDVGGVFTPLEFEGESESIRTGLAYVINPRAGQRKHIRLGGYRLSSDIESSLAGTREPQESRALTLTTFWQDNWPVSRIALGVNLEASFGQFDRENSTDDTLSFTDKAFEKFTGSFGLSLAAKPSERFSSHWDFSLRGQYANQSLPSIESFSLSGFYGVKAVEPSIFTSDRAHIAALQWSLPRLFTAKDKPARLRPSLFVEYAQGERFSLSSDDTSRATLAGAGIMLDVSLGRRVYGRFIYAKPFENSVTNEINDQQLLFELSFQ